MRLRRLRGGAFDATDAARLNELSPCPAVLWNQATYFFLPSLQRFRAAFQSLWTFAGHEGQLLSLLQGKNENGSLFWPKPEVRRLGKKLDELLGQKARGWYEELQSAAFVCNRARGGQCAGLLINACAMTLRSIRCTRELANHDWPPGARASPSPHSLYCAPVCSFFASTQKVNWWRRPTIPSERRCRSGHLVLCKKYREGFKSFFWFGQRQRTFLLPLAFLDKDTECSDLRILVWETPSEPSPAFPAFS